MAQLMFTDGLDQNDGAQAGYTFDVMSLNLLDRVAKVATVIAQWCCILL